MGAEIINYFRDQIVEQSPTSTFSRAGLDIREDFDR